MNVEEFQKKVDKDLEITKDNVYEKSMNYSSIYHKYISTYYRALNKLNELKIDKDKIYGDLYHEYKFQNKNGGYEISTKTEVDLYVKRDDIYIKVAKQFSNQEGIVKYLELVLDDIKSMSYTLKNYIEFEKLRMGV